MAKTFAQYLTAYLGAVGTLSSVEAKSRMLFIEGRISSVENATMYAAEYEALARVHSLIRSDTMVSAVARGLAKDATVLPSSEASLHMYVLAAIYAVRDCGASSKMATHYRYGLRDRLEQLAAPQDARDNIEYFRKSAGMGF